MSPAADRLGAPDSAKPLCPELAEVACQIPVEDLQDLRGCQAERLRRLGFPTAGHLARASVDDLLLLRGVGTTAVQSARRALARLHAFVQAAPLQAQRNPAALLLALRRQRTLVDLVREQLTACPERVRVVAQGWAVADVREGSLSAFAERLGHNRQTGANLAAAFWREIGPLRGTAAAADARIAELRRGRTSPLPIRELEESDPWFAGVTQGPGILRGYLEHFEAHHRVAELGAPGEFVVVPEPVSYPKRWQYTLREHLKAHPGPRVSLRQDVAAMLAPFGAPEVEGVVAAALGNFEPRPTLASVIRGVLEEARGPVTLAQAQERAAALGFEASPGQVRNALIRREVVCSGANTYLLRAHLHAWEPHRARACSVLAEIMQKSTVLQWSSQDLLFEARLRAEPWARDAEDYVVEHLLRDAPGFEWLRRGIFRLRRVEGAAAKRIYVQDAVLDALRRAGRPLTMPEIRQDVEGRRSVAVQPALRWPAVWLAPQQWGLADRDLGLDPAGIVEFDRLVGQELDRRGTVPAAALLSCAARAWPGRPLPPATVVARWATSRHGARLDASQTGLRPGKNPKKRAPSRSTEEHGGR